MVPKPSPYNCYISSNNNRKGRQVVQEQIVEQLVKHYKEQLAAGLYEAAANTRRTLVALNGER